MNLNKKIVDKLFLIPFIIATFFVIYKASVIGLVYDEAYTVLNYGWGEMKDVIFTNPHIANNHHLNSLLIKFLLNFGQFEFWIRLPNVLAFFLFAVSVFFLLRRLENQYIRLFSTVVLLINGLLLDFFSFARGYGLAISLMTFTILGLYDFLDDKYYQKKILSFLKTYKVFKNLKIYQLSTFIFFIVGSTAGLTIFSNFSFIVPMIVIVGVYALFMLIKSWKQNNILDRFFEHVYGSISFLFNFIICLHLILALRDAEKLYYGEDQGNLVTSTVVSVLKDSLYFRHTVHEWDNYFNYFSYILLAVLIVGLILLLYKKVRKDFDLLKFFTPKLFIICSGFLTLLAIYLMNVLLEVNFPFRRAAIYVVPVTVLTITFLLESLKLRYVNYLFALLFVAYLGLFTFNYSLDYHISYPRGGDHDAYFNLIIDEYNEPDLVHCIQWGFGPTTKFYEGFYNLKPTFKNIDSLDVVDEFKCDTIRIDRRLSDEEYKIKENFDEEFYYPNSETKLFINNSLDE